ncbi:integrase core domain-containing protein [Phaeobacter sp. 22II1-1F12B]|uniref:integrase core domain-containing protein n=1 Tax=Phaeobacter sp. 22II1-1F12B TaxID=1317111 RepID=UPI000B527FE3|nr:hypothetical protein ATO1_18080 [Phaeobacter sp. 22II1-1F12B]
MRFRSSPSQERVAENSSFKRASFQGAEHIESFNRRFRDELLKETLFPSLADARQQIRARQHDYNYHRPHSGLGNIPPVEFVAKKG